jgi:hypothetical protein
VGSTGGGVIVGELLLLVVGGTEMFWVGEVELELLAGVEFELELELELVDILDRVVDVAVTLADVHGVVGFALAQSQRELAAPRTLPAEAPQALITQLKAADWIAED